MDQPQFSLASAVRPLKPALVLVAVISGLINVLALAGSMYMLQVYDRVLPSRSLPTLFGLTIVLLILLTAQGALEFVRTRIMSRIGLKIEASLREPVMRAVLAAPLRTAPGSDIGTTPIRDLDTVRGYLSGLGPTAVFDLPWLPLFVVLLWLLHPWLGWFSLASASLLVLLTILTEWRTNDAIRASNASAFQRFNEAEAARRNAEVIQAMGMGGQVRASWENVNARFLNDQLRVSDAQGGIGAASRTVRITLQSLILGLGAWLSVRGEMSAGGIIAGTILLGRALAPVETSILHWKSFGAARQAHARLRELLAKIGPEPECMPLPRPHRFLQVEGLTVAAPGQSRPIIQNVGFTLKAGEALGVIGPSASGKSTLARALVGAWNPVARGGVIRLDGATLDQYGNADLGRDIGYLPQAIELFDGTIARNIARMAPEPDSARVIEAAQAAGCHDMIVALPAGYNTRIGEHGNQLSAGQRQRLALARALYGDPFLVVLDEPNSNLDSFGDAALGQAIRAVRERGGIVVVIAHRPSALAGVDTLLALVAGRVQALGPKDEVLAKVAGPPPRPGNVQPVRQAGAAQNVVTTTFGPRGGVPS